MNAGSNAVDVLIVGAGPVGLAMACELLRHGVTCRIVDKAAAPVQTSRALGVQARTLEVFEAMGVIDAALAAGTKARGVTFHRGDEDILYISLQHIREKESLYPFLLILPQSQTETILSQRVEELGGVVERSHELINIRQKEGGAIAQIQQTETNEVEEIRAKWLIGCDGASSQVRKILAMPFEGTTAPEEWLLADVDLDWQRTRETTHGWFTKDGVFAVFPLPTGQWRLFAPAGKHTSDVSLQVFQNLLEQYTGDTQTTVSNPTWMSKFKVNYRMVNHYRQGHVLLAGDAAHIHSPFGGQGMNIGIQDAYNLAWKLALVIQGKARESLLDTYQEERSPVARFILRGTQTATQGVLVTQNPGLRWVRDRLLIPLLRLNILQRKLAQEASELTVNYRRSSLSVSHLDPSVDFRTRLDWWKAPQAGDRLLPGTCLHYPSNNPTTLFQAFQGTHSNLLLFAGLNSTDYTPLVTLASTIQNTWGGLIKPHIVFASTEKPSELTWEGSLLLDPQSTLHTLYGAHNPALYFIRPDNHIAFRSQPIDEKALLTYLNTLFLHPTPPQ